MTRPAVLVAVVALALGAAAGGQDLDRDPINYSRAEPDNIVARLQHRLETGQAHLAFDEEHGYLRSLLQELRVPVSSQSLVFSKTSLQRDRIGPKTPRALYFNDDIYVGYCQHGEVMEVAIADPQLGAVFYTLDQEPAERPRLRRQTENCLICHGPAYHQGFPSFLMRSVYTDRGGYPILSAGSFRTDQTSPWKERFGGWYVTGTGGGPAHLGNLVVRDREHPEEADNAAGQNVTDLRDRFTTAPYLTGHSDLVALLVLAHQTEMHNLITRANFLARQALHDEAVYNQAFGRPADYRSEGFAGRIKSAGEPLVKYLLFSGETSLTEPVRGTSGFAEEFPKAGPRDRRGRSLRDFDLQHRLFKYPCSYLIYSASFDSLPGPVKDYVVRRLGEVLTGKDTSPDFAHLSAADRRAILEILRETKPGLAAAWR